MDLAMESLIFKRSHFLNPLLEFGDVAENYEGIYVWILEDQTNKVSMFSHT